MSAAVLATKLAAPARRAGVARPRLLRLLDATLADGNRLTLVPAPAGSGKTTLATDWVAGLERPPAGGVSVAWLSLDPADDDPARFLTHLLAALDGAGLATGPDAGHVTALLAAVVNEAARAGAADPRRRWVLVLDDYHLVTEPDVHAAVTFLLDHGPASLRLLLLTRTEPPLPLARLRARGELTEVRAADLRFTPTESAAFLRDVMRLDLRDEDVAALARRTEGWATGLQLAGLSLRGSASRGDVEHVVRGFTGSHRVVLDYLGDEVLARQPADVRDFLLRTSVLDRLSASLCDAVTGRGDGARLLDRLERDDVFVVPLDEARTWFRYHHLFADALRARLAGGAAEAEIRELHRAAADWYADHGAVPGATEDAVRHAFAAGDAARAAGLVERALPDLRRQRRDTTLLAWLRALPDEVVRDSPALSVAVGWAALAGGDLDGLERRLDDAARALAAGAADPVLAAGWADTEELRTAPAMIEVYRASLSQGRGDVARSAAHARAALGLARPGDHLVRGAALGFLGLAAWVTGDVRQALPTFERSVAELRAAGSHVDALDATIVLADMWVTAGRPHRARLLLEQALRTATAHGEPYPRATADLHTSLAELALDRGDPAAAEAGLATAARLAERGSITENRHRRPAVTARLRAAHGDHASALALLDEAAAEYLPGCQPDLRPIPAMRARVHVAMGDLGAARAWAAGAGVDLADAAEFAREYEHLTLVRLHLAAAGEDADPDVPSQVDDLLQRLETAAVADARHGCLPEIRRLRAAIRSPGTSPGPAERLSAREHEVLDLLATELTGPQIARELYVSLNTLRTHTRRIFTKLDVHTRAAAVRRARDLALLGRAPAG